MFYEIIHDTGETPNRCTIAPNAGRPDFRVLPVKGVTGALGPLRSPVLLHPDGPCLTTFRDRWSGGLASVAAIDCVWRRLAVLMGRIGGELPLLARIPDGFETAYPRKSRRRTDPAGGLATIEALFVASAVLGACDPSLLSNYHFGREFLERNRGRFLELGVPLSPGDVPAPPPRPKHSLQRRADRGKTLYAIG